MNSLMVKNGIELQQFDNYTLYEMFTDNDNKYYMCLPSSNQEEYQMTIDFPEEYYNSLLESERISEINRICDTIYKANYKAIYILPNINTYALREAKEENDDHAYHNLLKALHKYTYDTYMALKDNDGLKLNQAICIISQTEDDKKLMDWLDINMPGCFTMLDYRNLLEKDMPTEDDSWTTLGGVTEGIEKSNNKSNHKVRILVPNKHGFLNITFIIVILSLSLFIGISIATLLIK